MGCGFSSAKVLPIDRYNPNSETEHTLEEHEIKVINEEIYVLCSAYEKVYKNNLELRNKLAKLEKNNLECCVCYNRDKRFKKKTRCQHDICTNCFDIIVDKKCPICRIKIKK